MKKTTTTILNIKPAALRERRCLIKERRVRFHGSGTKFILLIFKCLFKFISHRSSPVKCGFWVLFARRLNGTVQTHNRRLVESIRLWTCNSTAVVESGMTDADCWRQPLKITPVCWADLSVPGLFPKSTSATRFPRRPITLWGTGRDAHPQSRVITNRLVRTSIHRIRDTV